MACISQANIMTGAFKELHLQIVLQLLNLITQWRLRDMQAFGCPCEMKFFGYDHEVIQTPQINYLIHELIIQNPYNRYKIMYWTYHKRLSTLMSEGFK